MVLCHVSWVPLTFTWKSGWTFWPSECCCALDDLHLCSCRWRPNAFLGFIVWISHEFLGCTMNLVLCTYFRMLLDGNFSRSGLGTCARDRKMNLSLQACVLGDFMILNSTCSLMCPFLIKSDFELTFCFCFFT